MSDLDKRIGESTQFAGHNRLAILSFSIGGETRYGINVFKVREVVDRMRFSETPGSQNAALGTAIFRGHSILLLDLAQAMGMPSSVPAQGEESNHEVGPVIITEFNRSVQGFVISSVDKIIHCEWSNVIPPPNGADNGYLTAIAHLKSNSGKGGSERIQIVDIERILFEQAGRESRPDAATINEAAELPGLQVMIVDDSLVARRQMREAIESLGANAEEHTNGREALDALKNRRSRWPDVLVTDIEMPEMDGYSLTRHVRGLDNGRELPILVHSSISGVFNESLVEDMGADGFVSKYDANDFCSKVIASLNRSE